MIVSSVQCYDHTGLGYRQPSLLRGMIVSYSSALLPVAQTNNAIGAISLHAYYVQLPVQCIERDRPRQIDRCRSLQCGALLGDGLIDDGAHRETELCRVPARQIRPSRHTHVPRSVTVNISPSQHHQLRVSLYTGC